MSLLLRQIVYTSFPGIGFRTIASEQVSPEIQQAFIQLVSQHWKVYNPPNSGYKAVYLHQLTPNQNLFGWLYNNRTDNNNPITGPYFICYYLTKPLQAQDLDMIFTCLYRGPVTLIDRYNIPASLETLFIEDCWTYQSASTGVIIPLDVCQQSFFALKQGALLNLFLSDNEQKMLIKPNAHGSEPLREGSNYLEIGARIVRQTPVIQALENVVTGIKSKDTTPVEVPDVVTVNVDTKALATTEIPEIIYPRERGGIVSQKINHAISVLGNKNVRMGFIAVIAAVITPIGGAIYGILHLKIFTPSQQTIPVVQSSAFYQNFAEVSQVPQGVFNYGGSTVFASVRSQTVLDAIADAQPLFYLRYTEPLNNKPGSSKGIQMLLNGELAIAQSSRPLRDDEYSKAKSRGFTLEQVPVAIDGIAFFTNPGVNVTELSVDRLQAIFTGKVTNWKQLGGDYLPIVPLSKPADNSTTLDILFEGLKGANLGNNVQAVRDITASVRQVAATPGAIGYGTASEISNQKTIRLLRIAKKHSKQYIPPVIGNGKVNTKAFQNGTYPLTRTLFVVIRRDGQISEQGGVAYANLLLSKQGQQLIEKAGFVPIRQ